MPFDVCFTSPLSRAKKTAEIVLKGRNIPIIDEPRIIEMGFGELEGKCCSKDGWEMPDSFHAFFDDPEHYEPVGTGESFADVKARVGEFLHWLSKEEFYRDSKILISTHGAALAGMMNTIKGETLAKYWGIGVHKNCAVTKVEVVDGTYTIIFENQVYYDDEVKDW